MEAKRGGKRKDGEDTRNTEQDRPNALGETISDNHGKQDNKTAPATEKSPDAGECQAEIGAGTTQTVAQSVGKATGETISDNHGKQDNKTAPATEKSPDAGECRAEIGAGTTQTVAQSVGKATEMDAKASVSKLLEEMPEKLLVCKVCKEDFQSPQRLPRVLPCHHAYCDQCLEGMCKDNHLKCPQCRRSVTVGAPFPVETTRMTLLDLKKIMEGQYCEGCSENVKAIARCPKCEESLCEDCCQAHKKVKATRDHSLVSLAEVAIDPSKLLQLTEKCCKHEEKKLKFYCNECQQPACSTCAVLSHTGHKMVELEAALKSEKTKLNAECQRLREAMPTFQARVDSSTHRLQQFDARRQEISSKVQEYFTRARNILNDREAKVLSELDAMTKEDKKVLEDQQASDQSLLSEAQANLEFGERISLLGLPTQLLSSPQDMAKTHDDLEKRRTLPRNPDPVYEVDCGIDNLTATVDKMGNIKRKAVDDGASSDSKSSETNKRQNCKDENEQKPTAQSAPEPVSPRFDIYETVEPVGVKAEVKMESSQSTSTSSSRSSLTCVEVLLLPHGGGTFQAHLESVGASLTNVLERNYDVHFQTRSMGQRTRNLPVLIVFQSQGRPGDEFPGALPQELRGSSQSMVVALVQDDEITTAGKDIVPAGVPVIGVVNIHVIPMQQHLHVDGFSLCTRNQQAVREIAQLLKLEAKRLAFPGQQRLPSGNTNRSSPDTQKSSIAPSFLPRSQSREVKETVVGILALPRSSGAFKEHLDSVTRSLVQEVQQVRKVRFADWDPGHGSGDSITLIVFLSQGSPGVEFPGAVPQELRGSSLRVVVVVIQDDETSAADKNIVPSDVHLLGVVNVHVIPMQHQLHRQGSSLCARNKQAVKEIAHLLSS